MFAMRRVVKKMAVWVGRVMILGLLGFFTGLGIWVYHVVKDIPDPSQINTYRPDLSTQILDVNDRVMAYLFKREHRLWVPLSQISENLQMAVIVAEDDTFFQHQGINYRETWNALKADLEKKRYARGGSTITQQLAKNVFLSKEKTLARKIKEYFLAHEIEQRLPKKKILELYLNEVEWGDGVYGAEAASRIYFGKPASQLEIQEAALLAAMLPNPKYLNPMVRLERVKKRQHRILRLMYANKLLTWEELSDAQAAPIVLREGSPYPLLMAAQDRRNIPSMESCPMERLEKYLLRRYGSHRLYHEGMKIKTTLDGGLQDAFEVGIRESMAFLENDPGSVVKVTLLSEPWILVMTVEDTPRAMVCLEKGQSVDLLLDRLKSSRPPDALYDYILEKASDVPWRDLVVTH
jgi:monofunctional biosynthetic peptidoglycan transglycosylase